MNITMFFLAVDILSITALKMLILMFPDYKTKPQVEKMIKVIPVSICMDGYLKTHKTLTTYPVYTYIQGT